VLTTATTGIYACTAGFFSSNVIVSMFGKPMMPFNQRVVGTPPVLAEEEVPTVDTST